ncbi:MAG: glucodextranase DOMON-like domain-containing protein [Bifidobacterium sp.]|uniref:Glucodextranase DOMON-like domain-containing protein n=3 Tax=Bifidobacterium TaxID=1678 RepID=A0AB39UAW4_9BIFI
MQHAKTGIARMSQFGAKKLLSLCISSLLMLAGNAVVGVPAFAQDDGDEGQSPWELSTTNPFTDDYHATFTGNGYFAARVPSYGQGYGAGKVPTSFQIQGFYTSGDGGKQWRVGGPAWTGLTVADSSSSFNDAFKTPCIFGSYCELEDAKLSGGLSVATDHGGYQGSGFVQGFGSDSARAVFTVPRVPSAGTYDMVFRYAAGNPGDNTTNPRKVSITAGSSTQTISMTPTEDGNWDTWSTARVSVDIPQEAISEGKVQLTIAGLGNGSDASKDSRVNIDSATLVATGGEPAEAPSNTTPEEHGLADYKQTLNMKTGAITTSARWTSQAGNVADVAYTVLPSRGNDQLGLVNVKVTPVSFVGDDHDFVITDTLDPQTTSNASLERSVDSGAKQIALTTTLNGTNQRASYVSQLEGDGSLSQSEYVGNGVVQQSRSATLSVGQSYDFTKFVGLATNQDTADNTTTATKASAALVASSAASDGLANSVSTSDAAWAEIWEGDIEIGGDDQLQSEVRASRFYLMTSVGERAWSPSPTGLSSDNYGGHAFWDTETWMWPSLMAQDPSIAKAVLQYRANRLSAESGAAYNAKNTYEWNEGTSQYELKSYGDGSALRFPWEGGLDGKEQTTSEFFGGHEIHVTADIALAFWQYYQATGDLDWLKSTGYQVISGAADFWVARSVKESDNLYHIYNVTPPDEWASNDTTGRDDSAYTNFAASKVMAIANEAAALADQTPNAEWTARSGHFYIPEDALRNITQEYENYNGSGIKQADVVMLSYPWQNDQTAERTANDLDYYSMKVNEDASPSMTDAIHAIVAAEIGRADEALWYTKRSSTEFMRGPFNQFTEERGGGHAFTFLTGAGGFLQEFYYGYTGLRWGTNGVTLNPILPSSLDHITVKGLQYQGSTFDVAITKDTTTVTVTDGSALTVTDRGTASAGNPLTFATRTPASGSVYGTLIGSISTPSGGDNGPGTYKYPTAGVFTEGSYDLTDFKVYQDGDTLRFVSSVNGQILNPWNLEAMSIQLMHIYIRSDGTASTTATPAVAGTNINTDGAWQYVAIANPRKLTGSIGASGVFAANGDRVANVSLSVREQRDIVLTLPASAFTGVDLSKAAFQVDIMAVGEDHEGVNNIRPVYGCGGGTQEWSFCGGLGNGIGQSPYDSDTTDPNVIKAILSEGVNAAEVLAAKAGGAVLPFVALEAVEETDPGTDPEEPDPNERPSDSPIKSLAVTSLPTTRVFAQGTALPDFSGLEVTATLEDDKAWVMPSSEYKLTGFSSSQLGVKPITVTALGVNRAITAQFSVMIAAAGYNPDVLGVKTSLNTMITVAGKAKQAKFTSESWTVFSARLVTAKSVKGNPSATQSAVDAAYCDLLDAYNSLVIRL